MACIDCKILKERVGDLLLQGEKLQTKFQNMSAVVRALKEGGMTLDDIEIDGAKLKIKPGAIRDGT